MKSAVKIVLFLFFVFLATPTVVSVIKKNCDTSGFYSMSEEELAHKEVKAEYKFTHDIEFVNLASFNSALILSENLSRHDNVSAKIFIPPPELV